MAPANLHRVLKVAMESLRRASRAALGDQGSFKRSIETAQECLDRSESELVGPGIFSFRPANLAFYETTGAVALNDLDTALDAAGRALALFQEADRIDKADSVLVRLSRASALAKAGEVPEACLAAKAAVLDAADPGAPELAEPRHEIVARPA